MKGDEVVELCQRCPNRFLLGQRGKAYVRVADGSFRNRDNLDALHQRKQLVMERGRIHVIAEVSWRELKLWPASHRVQSRDDWVITASTQLRTLADSFVFCRVGNYYITV